MAFSVGAEMLKNKLRRMLDRHHDDRDES